MSRYNNSNRDPYELIVKYDGVCAETGVKLCKGAKAIYYPTSKTMYAIDSNQAREYYTWRNDLAMGHDY
jgi:hypothetical protein